MLRARSPRIHGLRAQTIVSESKSNPANQKPAIVEADAPLAVTLAPMLVRDLLPLLGNLSDQEEADTDDSAAKSPAR